MKRKLFLFSLSTLLVLFLGYGCSDDNSLSDSEIQEMIDNSLNGQWQIIPVDIAGSDWQGYENDYEGYYWATVDFPELTDYIFDDGAVHAYYYFNENKKTALPYVKTITGENGISFKETYSCVFELGNPSTVTFYLKVSDAGKYDGNLPAAKFKVLLIY